MVITTEYPLSVVFSYRPGTVNSVCTLIAHAIANPIPTYQSRVSMMTVFVGLEKREQPLTGVPGRGLDDDALPGDKFALLFCG